MAIQVEIGSGSPEGVVNKSPGYLYTQTDDTTLWRKAAGSGMSTAGWIRGDLNVYNIRDYGAKCDESNDDLGAWNLAMIAAQADPDAPGVVFHPGGISMISDSIVVPPDKHIQVIGGPGAVIRAMENFAGNVANVPMMVIDFVTDFGDRFGAVRDLRFEGGVPAEGEEFEYRADIGLKVNAVQRDFQNLDIRNCRHIGLYVAGAQNCTFTSCNFENNGTSGSGLGDTNCLIDLGAGNNLFDRCQFTPTYDSDEVINGVANLMIRQSGSSAGQAFDQPEANTFVACQFERAGDSNLATIMQLAGRNNTFISCTVVTRGGRVCVLLLDTDGVLQECASNTMRFLNCRFTGTGGGFAIQSGGTSSPGVIVQNGFFENFSQYFQTVETDIEVDMPFHVGEDLLAGTYGSDTVSSKLIQRGLMLDEMPIDTANGIPAVYNGTAPWFYDVGRHLLHFYGAHASNDLWRSCDLVQQQINDQNTPNSTSDIAIWNFGVRYHKITITGLSTNPTLTILNPANEAVGLSVTIEIFRNQSGFTPTFNFQNKYIRKGALVLPTAIGNSSVIRFEWNGTNWQEVSRSEDR